MNRSGYTKEEVAARGQAIYEQRLKDEIETGNIGKYLVIDIETGEYELDEDQVAASKRAYNRHPDHARFGMRIGYPTIGRIGFAPQSAQP